MNAGKRRGTLCFAMLCAIVTASTCKAEDVTYQQADRLSLQQPKQIDPLERLIPWTFALSQEWEEEQMGNRKGFDGFILAKKLNPLHLLIPGTSLRILAPAPGKHVVKSFPWIIPGKDEAKALYWSLLAHQRFPFFDERDLYV